MHLSSLSSEPRAPASLEGRRLLRRKAEVLRDFGQFLNPKEAAFIEAVPMTAPMPLQPNRADVEAFIESLFRYADPDGYISLRAFSDEKEKKDSSPPLFLEAVKVEAPNLIDQICNRIFDAAARPGPHVFCPPVCTFKTADSAKASDLAEGVALTVECDSHPKAALETLTALLGPPTVKVASGGVWKNPDTGEQEAKLHLHWRLKEPTRDAAGHKMLREARELAAVLVDADRTAVAIVHPLRWPGSWHRKSTPKPVRLQTNPESEIDLADALDKLREVCPLPDRDDRKTGELRGDVNDIDAALDAIPNNADWHDWNHIGMTTWCATGGTGFDAFDRWSRQSSKYDSDKTRARWNHYKTSPPNRLGAGTLFWRAAQADSGWRKPSLGPRRDDRRYGQRDKPNGHDKTAASDGPTWSDPDESILDESRGELPAFPLDTLAPHLAEWAKRNAIRTGTTVDHVAVPMLGILGSLVGCCRRVGATPQLTPPCTDWTAVVGVSGSGKTPGLDATRKPLASFEHGRKAEIDNLRREHETKEARAEYALARWKEQCDTANKMGQPLPEKPADADKPPQFVEPRLHITDPTIEGLAKRLQIQRRGLLLIRDELSGVFANMGRYSGGDDRAFWLEAWNGGPYVVERANKPSFPIARLLVGITGGFQPDKVSRAFAGDQDGFYSRILFSWPKPAKHVDLRREGEEIDPDTTNTIGRLVKLSDTDEGGFAISRVVPLTEGAFEEFLTFLHFVQAEKEAHEGRAAEWLSKASEHALRLAGTLTFIEWGMVGGPEPSEIGTDTMRRAIKMVQSYFWPHSEAVLRLVRLTTRDTTRRKVLKWIRARGLIEVSVFDIRRDCLGQSNDRAETEKLFADDGSGMATP